MQASMLPMAGPMLGMQPASLPSVGMPQMPLAQSGFPGYGQPGGFTSTMPMNFEQNLMANPYSSIYGAAPQTLQISRSPQVAPPASRGLPSPILKKGKAEPPEFFDAENNEKSLMMDPEDPVEVVKEEKKVLKDFLLQQMEEKKARELEEKIRKEREEYEEELKVRREQAELRRRDELEREIYGIRRHRNRNNLIFGKDFTVNDDLSSMTLNNGSVVPSVKVPDSSK